MMRSSRAKLVVGLASVLMAVSACVAEPPDGFEYKSYSQLSDQRISEWGHRALGIDPHHWKHGETTHFIIHCFANGEKIANRSELFYDEIRDFFGKRPDLLGARKSNIFAFNDKVNWTGFMRAYTLGGVLPNAIGITRGDEFFYLSVGDDGRFDSQGKVQAHEMTHLVFNRFFNGRPPLWLNEGTAEYFGQRKTTNLVDFRHQMGQAPKFPLGRLFGMNEYPRNPLEVEAFYAEAAIVVDFLTNTDARRALLPRFIDMMIANNNLNGALAIYGYHNFPEFEDDYQHYRKRF
jgi:hypothetical protein